MRRLEPAEVIWLGVLPVMLTTSAVLIDHGHKPLTQVARDHPYVTGYIGAHLLGLLPPALDAISVGHRTYLRARARRRTRTQAAGLAAASAVQAATT